MAARLTLICHGTTRALRAATFGSGGDGLDEGGRRGAAALRNALGTVDRCWTSPARAAVETAAALGLSAVVDARLRDCDYGSWSGKRFEQVLVREPRRLLRWLRDPGNAPHGGETIAQLLARVAEWMGDPARKQGHAVAVSHAAVVRAAIVHAIGADAASFWRIDAAPLCRADLRTNGRRWVLRAVVPFEGASADAGGGRGV